MKKILGLGLVALAIILGGVPAFAADMNAAQMVQIDQNGTRNNVDVTSGVINTVDNVTNVGTIATVSTVSKVVNVDTVSVVTNVTNVDSVDVVDTVSSVNLGTFTLKDATTGNKAKVFADGAIYVKSTAEAGDSKSIYFVSVDVAANTEIDAGTFTVTTGKTFYINNMSLVSSGLATLRIMSGTTEIARVMTTPSCQTAINPKYQAVTVAEGTIVTLKIKNRETAAMDIVCSLEGSEK